MMQDGGSETATSGDEQSPRSEEEHNLPPQRCLGDGLGGQPIEVASARSGSGTLALTDALVDTTHGNERVGGDASGLLAGATRNVARSLSAEAVCVAGPVRQVSLLQRRGRPNRELQGAMRRALQGTRPPQGSASAMVLDEGRARHNEAQKSAAGTAVALRRQREEQVKRASVEPTDFDRLVRKPIGGFMLLSLAAEVAVAASQLGSASGERLDPDAVAAGQVLLGERPVPISSKRMRADKLGVPERRLSSIEHTLSSAAVLLDRAGRAGLKKSLARLAGTASCLLYVDAMAYDETPLPVAVTKEGLGIAMDSSAGSSPSASSQPVAALASAAAGILLGSKISSTQGTQKVMSMMQSGGLLVRIGGHLISFIPDTLSPLALLPNGTAQAVKTAVMGGCGASRAASVFVQKTRAVCTDKASANMAAERLVLEERGKDWSHIHNFCSAHRVATCHEMTFVLINEHIKGMIHCVLSLHNGSAMSAFRAALREEVSSRFIVRRGVLSEEASEHKRWILKLFVSHGQQLPMRRILLALCPNGDWRRAEVEYILAPGQDWTREQALEHVTSGLLAALCASQPKLYKRQRWTGADLATDALGILEACHRLLSSTFLRFAAKFQQGAQAQRLLSAAAAAALGGAAVPPDCEGQSERGDETAADATRSLVPLGEEGGSIALADTDPRAAEPNWAEVNAKHRRLGVEWVSSDPMALLIAQRQVMEPLRQLMARQFLLAGEAWEKEQRAKIAEKAQANIPAKCTDREYRLAIAGTGANEAHFFQQLGMLFTEDALWKHMPTSAHTLNSERSSSDWPRGLVARLRSSLHSPIASSRCGCSASSRSQMLQRPWPRCQLACSTIGRSRCAAYIQASLAMSSSRSLRSSAMCS